MRSTAGRSACRWPWRRAWRSACGNWRRPCRGTDDTSGGRARRAGGGSGCRSGWQRWSCRNSGSEGMPGDRTGGRRPGTRRAATQWRTRRSRVAGASTAVSLEGFRSRGAGSTAGPGAGCRREDAAISDRFGSHPGEGARVPPTRWPAPAGVRRAGPVRACAPGRTRGEVHGRRGFCRTPRGWRARTTR